MEWSIQQIARFAGVTSRTLRHYDDIGILPPSRVASNGYRMYDERSLARLQRILLLRRLGVGLGAIADSLEGAGDSEALRLHLSWLRDERDRITRQLAAVEHTLAAMHEGLPMDAAAALDGFDHGQYKQEVTERWGAKAYADGAAWWESLDTDGQAGFQQEHRDLVAAYAEAAKAGLRPDSDQVQALVARHYRWIATAWRRDPEPTAFANLADMYVSDPRFAANYGGEDGAIFVRDAMHCFVERVLR